MYNDSKQYILFPLSHGFGSFMVLSAFPYSCTLFECAMRMVRLGYLF